MARGSTLLLACAAAAGVLGAPRPLQQGRAEVGSEPSYFLRMPAARDFPGFAGAYLTDDGVLNVCSTATPSREDIHRLAVAMQLEADRVRVVRVRFSYVQLHGWLQDVLRSGIPDVALAGVDERHNRAFLHVTTSLAAARARALATQVGVPADALAIEVTGPVKLQPSVLPFLASVDVIAAQRRGVLGAVRVSASVPPDSDARLTPLLSYRVQVVDQNGTVRCSLDGTAFRARIDAEGRTVSWECQPCAGRRLSRGPHTVLVSVTKGDDTASVTASADAFVQ